MGKPELMIIGAGKIIFGPDKYGGIERITNLLEHAPELKDTFKITHVNDEYAKEYPDRNRYTYQNNQHHYQWLKEHLTQTAPAIVNAATPETTLAAKEQTEAVIVETVHQATWQYQPRIKQWKDFLGFYLRDFPLMKKAAQASDELICYSHAQKAALLRRQPALAKKPIHVLPQPISENEMHKTPYTKKIFDSQIIVGIGAVIPRKNWLELAHACERTGKQLILIGPLLKPHYAEEIKQANPSVTLMGEVGREVMLETVRKATLVAHPSLGEVGSCLAVLEAMAQRKPVLVHQKLGEIIEGNGYVLPDANREQIAEVLEQLDFNVLKKQAAKSYQLIEQKHTEKAHNDAMRTILLTALAKHG